MATPIDGPGTPEDAWAAWPRLAHLPPGGLGSPASVVVLAAHPEDEVLGAGGILSLMASAGTRLRLVAVTDGEASHRGLLDPGELVTRRCAERGAALRELGAAAERKRAAIGCFASQLENRADDLRPVLAPKFVAHFTRDFELLFRGRGR